MKLRDFRVAQMAVIPSFSDFADVNGMTDQPNYFGIWCKADREASANEGRTIMYWEIEYENQTDA
jgi:hypothetical protein